MRHHPFCGSAGASRKILEAIPHMQSWVWNLAAPGSAGISLKTVALQLKSKKPLQADKGPIPHEAVTFQGGSHTLWGKTHPLPCAATPGHSPSQQKAGKHLGKDGQSSSSMEIPAQGAPSLPPPCLPAPTPDPGWEQCARVFSSPASQQPDRGGDGCSGMKMHF